MTDKIYLDSIVIAVGRFEIGTAMDGSILVSAGTGKGQRIVGLTPEECVQLHICLGEYLHMRAIEEKE